MSETLEALRDTVIRGPLGWWNEAQARAEHTCATHLEPTELPALSWPVGGSGQARTDTSPASSVTAGPAVGRPRPSGCRVRKCTSTSNVELGDLSAPALHRDWVASDNHGGALVVLPGAHTTPEWITRRLAAAPRGTPRPPHRRASGGHSCRRLSWFDRPAQLARRLRARVPSAPCTLPCVDHPCGFGRPHAAERYVCIPVAEWVGQAYVSAMARAVSGKRLPDRAAALKVKLSRSRGRAIPGSATASSASSRARGESLTRPRRYGLEEVRRSPRRPPRRRSRRAPEATPAVGSSPLTWCIGDGCTA